MHSGLLSNSDSTSQGRGSRSKSSLIKRDAIAFLVHPSMAPASVSLVLQAVGALTIAYFLLSFSSVLLRAFVLPGRPVCLFFSDFLHQLTLSQLKKFGAKQGAWAGAFSFLQSPTSSHTPVVVTGASDGIGREFALQLARAGFNVFLAARNPDKLAAVASEIRMSMSPHHILY